MKIAICEDEKIFRDSIVDYLKPYVIDMKEIVFEEFINGESLALAYNSDKRFDLVFLDIEMPGLSGIEVGRIIRNLDNSAILIFITSYGTYVRNAFSINAFQYLQKPVMREVFNEEFERAISTYKKLKYNYKILYNGETNILEVKDIIYLETYSRHLRVKTIQTQYEYMGNIGVEEKRLTEYNFLRCHQGFLVNMQYIFKPGNNIFILSNQETIPISKHLKSNVMSTYNKYISRCCL